MTIRVPVARAALALAAAGAAAFPSCPVFAQNAAALKETVVTATRTPTRADELVSEVTVIDRQAIEASSGRTLTELLARTAGVQMSANGGHGKTSNIFIRGTENRHTILMIDGVRIGSATAGTPSWDNIPVDMIERIEVLKGPASALYGSEGVGGVVQLFTRKGREGFFPHAALTVGSRGHALASAGASGGQGALSYNLGVQRLREAGFSSTNPNAPFGNYNADTDPFRQDAINGSLQWRFAPGWSADAGLLYSDGVSGFDDGPGVDARTAVRVLSAHLAVKGRLLPQWATELQYAQGNDASNIIVANSPGAFKTEQTQWTWQNTVDTPLGAVLAGLEQREQKVSGSTAYTVARRSIDSAFVGLNGSAGAFSWQANARHDRNSQFGSASTGFIGGGWRLSPQWRVHASHGTSFVAPSFNQLYFPGFGNPLLQAERGKNTDLGLTWTAGAHEVKLVRFDNRIRGFMTNTTLPQNIPRARIDGWTLAWDGKYGALAVRASLDALNPRNELNGRQLPRRAKEHWTLSADYAVGDWRFGGGLLHAGNRFDDAANTLPLPAYTTADLYADWQLARDWSVQAKLNNAADKVYETARGYNQARRSVYVTLRWQPK